jgi:hypothetical protein
LLQYASHSGEEATLGAGAMLASPPCVLHRIVHSDIPPVLHVP